MDYSDAPENDNVSDYLAEVEKQRFSAFVVIDGKPTELQKGDKVRDFRGKEWTFQGVTHPRKLYVTKKYDRNGDDFWPNMESREFFASVFDAGIWDNYYAEWSFEPNWSTAPEIVNHPL